MIICSIIIIKKNWNIWFKINNIFITTTFQNVVYRYVNQYYLHIKTKVYVWMIKIHFTHNITIELVR